MEASSEQIKEYEAQLADVEELLKASPVDAALLSLKKDLEELLALTKASLPEPQAPVAAESSSVPQKSTTTETTEVCETEESAPAAAASAPTDTTTTATETADAAAAPPIKKKLKVKDFEIPEHLKPKEGDTEAETNKKRRAVKKLKNKWREKKKEVESTQKQHSWQSFQSKKKRKDKSIFATQDGSNARVGVISANSMTEFGERKRHKHT